MVNWNVAEVLLIVFVISMISFGKLNSYEGRNSFIGWMTLISGAVWVISGLVLVIYLIELLGLNGGNIR